MPATDHDATPRGPMAGVQPVCDRPGDAESRPEGRPGQQQGLLNRSYLISVGPADPPPEYPQRGNRCACVLVSRRHHVPLQPDLLLMVGHLACARPQLTWSPRTSWLLWSTPPQRFRSGSCRWQLGDEVPARLQLSHRVAQLLRLVVTDSVLAAFSRCGIAIRRPYPLSKCR